MGLDRHKRRWQEVVDSEALQAAPEIKTPQELENYSATEKCVLVAIRPDQQKSFADKGFFRNLVKSHKKALLSPCLKEVSIPEHTRSFVVHDWEYLDAELQDIIKSDAVFYHEFSYTRTYEDLSVDECLRLLGDSNGVMVSFETIGHIAHLNLPNERLWAKHIIAKILLDKHKHIRTVVNKTKEVETEFRTMDLELLAGDDDLIATQNENGHTFKIDFRNVYWNSRLIRERERLSETFTRGDIVIDMFAGVGPFAIYAAGKGCLVFANDLNPTGTQYIELNAKLNKLSDKIFAYNCDARDFVKTVIDSGILDKQTTSVKDHAMKVDSKVHFVMNLPKDAIEFLDSLKGLAKGIDPENIRTCVVHCYCFSEAADVETDIDARIERVLGVSIPDKKIVTVRDVSPKKHMYCIEFKIPTTLLSADH